MIPILGTLLGVIVGALLNHYLENNRTKASLILDRKLETYSNILVKIASDFQDEERNIGSDPDFIKNIRPNLARSLSMGRLLAGPKLEQKLRDYYDEAVLFWENHKNDDALAKIVVEIEQLMREELGQENILKLAALKNKSSNLVP